MHSPALILKNCNGRNGKGDFASHTGTAGGRKMTRRNGQNFRLSYDRADEMQGSDSQVIYSSWQGKSKAKETVIL